MIGVVPWKVANWRSSFMSFVRKKLSWMISPRELRTSPRALPTLPSFSIEMSGAWPTGSRPQRMKVPAVGNMWIAWRMSGPLNMYRTVAPGAWAGLTSVADHSDIGKSTRSWWLAKAFPNSLTWLFHAAVCVSG